MGCVVRHMRFERSIRHPRAGFEWATGFKSQDFK